MYRQRRNKDLLPIGRIPLDRYVLAWTSSHRRGLGISAARISPGRTIVDTPHTNCERGGRGRVKVHNAPRRREWNAGGEGRNKKKTEYCAGEGLSFGDELRYLSCSVRWRMSIYMRVNLLVRARSRYIELPTWEGSSG